MSPREERLEEEVRDLRDRLAVALGQNLAGAIHAATGVRYRGAQIIALLYAARGTVATEFIWSELFTDPATGEGCDHQNVKVQISVARKHLREIGAPGEMIKHDFNFGYRLEPEFRLWLDFMLHRQAVAA